MQPDDSFFYNLHTHLFSQLFLPSSDSAPVMNLFVLLGAQGPVAEKKLDGLDDNARMYELNYLNLLLYIY